MRGIVEGKRILKILEMDSDVNPFYGIRISIAMYWEKCTLHYNHGFWSKEISYDYFRILGFLLGIIMNLGSSWDLSFDIIMIILISYLKSVFILVLLYWYIILFELYSVDCNLQRHCKLRKEKTRRSQNHNESIFQNTSFWQNKVFRYEFSLKHRLMSELREYLIDFVLNRFAFEFTEY